MSTFSYIVAVAGAFGMILGLAKMATAKHYEKADPSRGTGYNYAGGVLLLVIGFIVLAFGVYLKIIGPV